jgi:hypothetical protein
LRPNNYFSRLLADTSELIHALQMKDPTLMNRSGKALVAASVATELGVTDIDGRAPRALTIADV